MNDSKTDNDIKVTSEPKAQSKTRMGSKTKKDNKSTYGSKSETTRQLRLKAHQEDTMTITATNNYPSNYYVYRDIGDIWIVLDILNEACITIDKVTSIPSDISIFSRSYKKIVGNPIKGFIFWSITPLEQPPPNLLDSLSMIDSTTRN